MIGTNGCPTATVAPQAILPSEPDPHDPAYVFGFEFDAQFKDRSDQIYASGHPATLPEAQEFIRQTLAQTHGRVPGGLYKFATSEAAAVWAKADRREYRERSKADTLPLGWRPEMAVEIGAPAAASAPR